MARPNLSPWRTGGRTYEAHIQAPFAELPPLLREFGLLRGR